MERNEKTIARVAELRLRATEHEHAVRSLMGSRAYGLETIKQFGKDSPEVKLARKGCAIAASNATKTLRKLQDAYSRLPREGYHRRIES